MLNSINLSDKTYQELLMDAIAQIPLYSGEWTNFNISDPGITMLQNLTAFQLIQQEQINEVTEQTRRNLLKLVGFTAKENRAATVLVQAPAEGGPILPVGYQLWSGAVPFETTEVISLQPWGLKGIYGSGEEGWRDLTRLLEGGASAYPFGRRPRAGDSFLCLLDGTPEVGEPVRLWLSITQEELRNPFEDETQIPAFSRVRWQYLTAEGWQDARFEDETMGLLRSGCITLWLESGFPVELEGEVPVSGCALRCLLEEADYDRPPRLQAVAAHLFPMKQQNTCVQCVTLPGAAGVELRDRLPQMGFLEVFCKRTEDGPYYHYSKGPLDRSGRYYQVEENYWGLTLSFQPDNLPASCEDGVRVVCYDSDMIHHRLLGPVYGYDRQTVQLDLVENVLPDNFLLMVEVPMGRGKEPICRFVAPEEVTPEGFSYSLRSKQAQLVIEEPGLGGCQLLLAQCTTTLGSLGNLRAGTTLEQLGGYDGTEVETSYFCPAPGRGGVSYESDEEVRTRFAADMRRTIVAVRAEDYEALVRQTPGLCIHKVRAVAVGKENLIRIAVKPYTEEQLPKLSADYLRQIQAYMEPRRLLTTRFEIRQPRYVPVGVNVTLSIRGMASYAREKVEELLRSALDYVNGPQNFGEWVRFHELYQRLSDLPFVDAVDALSLYPESREGTLVGSDVRLEEDSLCYPGTIRLTLREYGR